MIGKLLVSLGEENALKCPISIAFPLYVNLNVLFWGGVICSIHVSFHIFVVPQLGTRLLSRIETSTRSSILRTVSRRLYFLYENFISILDNNFLGVNYKFVITYGVYPAS